MTLKHLHEQALDTVFEARVEALRLVQRVQLWHILGIEYLSFLEKILSMMERLSETKVQMLLLFFKKH